MTASEIESVCRFFSTKKINLPPSNAWLKACIEWFLSENAGSTTQEIQVFAYDQLLLADLNVIAHACLPPSVNESRTTKLQGVYFLQVNYFLDVALSAYSQCQKIMKRNLIEDEDDNDQEEKKFWMNQQPSRMLKMEMTDGVHTVYGMEYSSISKLNHSSMLPGIKVLIKGPVECRSGVIMLQENNIDILGGELDSLYEVNHMNRLIARKLNIDENLLPINDELSRLPTGPAQLPDNQNCPPSGVPQIPNITNVNVPPTRNTNNANNRNTIYGIQENINNDYLLEDSDIFLNLPVDNLLENEHEPKCEPTGNKITEVNATVAKFKSKLLIKDDNWSLIVKLRTNETSIKASFDPDLLDRIIGFTPTELNSKENEIAINPAIKEKMDYMLKRSQEVVKNLSCCMTLAQNEGDELPIIIALNDESVFCNSV